MPEPDPLIPRQPGATAGPSPVTRRGLLTLAAAATVAAVLPRGLRAQSAPTPFSVLDFDWVDPVRQRPVPVRLYLPEASAAVPLVVFSHGIGGSREGYSHLGRHWAANGLASLHPQHVGSDRSLWRGSVFSLSARMAEAASDAEAIARVGDVAFVLDQVGRLPPLQSRLDLSRVAVAGHSYGANTALLASGATVERGGQPVRLRDPRVRAAVLLSAPPFYGEAQPERVLGAVQIPTLHVTTTEDVIRVPGYFSDAADRIAVFEATGGPDKTLAVFEGGSHNIFTDRTSGDPALNARVKAATQSLSLAFLQHVMGLDGQALQQWPQQHQALLARYVSRAT